MALLFSAQLVLFDPTVFEISAVFPSEIWDFPYFVTAGATSAPKSAIALNFSAQLVLFDPTFFGISAIHS
jgi:hypothetical protein